MIRERRAGTDEGQVRYLEAGSGWPAILIHGFPLSAEMWRPQLEAVPRGWRFLAPDLKGFGPSPGPPAESIEDMARGVVTLLDALEIERAVIGGLSMGGYVTLALYRIAPERFTGVILANTRAAADTSQAREGRDRMSALVHASGPSAVADSMLPTLLGRTTRASRPEVEPAVRRLIEANAAPGIDGAIQADPKGMAEFVERELPFGRFGRPEEVGAVVAFLASPRASWVSGASITVDGCQSRSNI